MQLLLNIANNKRKPLTFMFALWYNIFNIRLIFLKYYKKERGYHEN